MARRFGMQTIAAASTGNAATALAAICAVCLLILNRKVRAYEIVR